LVEKLAPDTRFNPRARDGRDAIIGICARANDMFQSTRP